MNNIVIRKDEQDLGKRSLDVIEIINSINYTFYL